MLPNLAGTLNNLGNHYRKLDNPHAAEAAWTAALDEQPKSDRAELLVLRSQHAAAGTSDAAPWLTSALRIASGGADLSAAVHAEGRRHDDATPESWRAAWTAASGAPLPPWLTVDRELLAAAEEWVSTPTYTAEHEYLVAHPELLDPTADDAVDEAVLAINNAERFRAVRDAARRDGIEVAYRPTLLAELGEVFRRAAPEEHRRLLRDRHADLVDDEFRDMLARLAEAEDATADDLVAVAAVEMLAAGADDALFDATYAALADPVRFSELLRRSAASTVPGIVLAGVAQFALTAATTEPEAALAFLYAALAADDIDEARNRLQQALTYHPAGRQEWPPLLLALRDARPNALHLLDTLYAPEE